MTATRGERGRFGERGESPGLEVVGRVREVELRAAARELGVQEVQFLDYVDGDLDQAKPGEAIAKIVGHLRRIRPDVVITFDPFGAYGHPDHIAICQFTTAAASCSADPAYVVPGQSAEAHRISKLYYMAWPPHKWAAYQAALKTLRTTVDGIERQANSWLESLPPEHHRALWGTQEFYRVFSTVNGGRARETDVFEGLR